MEAEQIRSPEQMEAALTPHPHLMPGMSAIVTKTE
jgi:hypothetical protein